jgi:hypothetical protein
MSKYLPWRSDRPKPAHAAGVISPVYSADEHIPPLPTSNLTAREQRLNQWVPNIPKPTSIRNSLKERFSAGGSQKLPSDNQHADAWPRPERLPRQGPPDPYSLTANSYESQAHNGAYSPGADGGPRYSANETSAGAGQNGDIAQSEYQSRHDPGSSVIRDTPQTNNQFEHPFDHPDSYLRPDVELSGESAEPTPTERPLDVTNEGHELPATRHPDSPVEMPSSPRPSHPPSLVPGPPHRIGTGDGWLPNTNNHGRPVSTQPAVQQPANMAVTAAKNAVIINQKRGLPPTPAPGGGPTMRFTHSTRPAVSNRAPASTDPNGASAPLQRQTTQDQALASRSRTSEADHNSVENPAPSTRLVLNPQGYWRQAENEPTQDPTSTLNLDASEPEDAGYDDAMSAQNSLHDCTPHSALHIPDDSQAQDANKWIRFNPLRGNGPKPATQAPSQPTGSTDIEKRINDAIKVYKVKKTPGMDPLSNLLAWIPVDRKNNAEYYTGELRKRDIELRKKDEQAVQLRNEKIRAEENLRSFEDERGRLRKRAVGLEEAQRNLQQKDDQIRSHLAELTKANTWNESLKGELQRAHGELAKVTQSRDEYKSWYEQVSGSLEDQKRELHETAGKLHQREQHLEKLQQAYESLQRDHRQLDQQRIRAIEHANGIRQELTEARERDVAQLTHEKEGLIAQHTIDISTMSASHDNEISRLKTEHKDEMTNKMKQLKSTIASQDRRIASYNTGTYKAISDDVFAATLKSLSQQISNLNTYADAPDTYSFDESLDPDKYLSRNAQQGKRIWPKFVRNICWRIILQGLFAYPLGFGALGSQGYGYDALLQIYGLFAKPSADGKSFRRRLLSSPHLTASSRHRPNRHVSCPAK